jgi:SagB-type dehydrogenase family enzyme
VREQTLLTREWVANKQTFLDWDTQPSSFKHYPHFCYRVALGDHPSLQWLKQTRCITDEHTVALKPYRRLNVPSAGNLHPIEIYVQIRNVAGLLSGLYHFDVLNEELVMITEIAGEGIESYVGMDKRFSGLIVMLSLVPFRSSWKYGLRAWRYLYLDLGHQIHALCTSARHFGLSLIKMSVNERLNIIMGMGEDEVIAAVYGVGEMSERSVKPLHKPLIRVQPTDYSDTLKALAEAVKATSVYNKIPDTLLYENFFSINKSRRSAREFHPNTMSDEIIQELMTIPSPPSLEIVTFIFQAHAMQMGLYRNGKCAVSGNFNSEIVHLLLDQRFISGSNMVVLIYAENFCASAHLEAGIYAQELYMACEHYGVGCSGIGAFYDEEALRWSDKPLLYAVAIGGKNE